jgi:hypothetical protein
VPELPFCTAVIASGQIGGGAQNWLIWASLVFAALEIREARNRQGGCR